MAVSASAPVFKNRIVRWIDYRLPIFTFMHHQLDEYPTPRNLSYRTHLSGPDSEGMSYGMERLKGYLRGGARAIALLTLAFVGARSGAAETPEARLPSCLACHGEQGTSSNAEVPSLGGQRAPYIEIQLYLYRERMNRNDVMNEAMTGVRNEDLGIIAELLSRLPPPVAVKEGVDAARIERGRG